MESTALAVGDKLLILPDLAALDISLAVEEEALPTLPLEAEGGEAFTDDEVPELPPERAADELDPPLDDPPDEPLDELREEPPPEELLDT